MSDPASEKVNAYAKPDHMDDTATLKYDFLRWFFTCSPVAEPASGRAKNYEQLHDNYVYCFGGRMRTVRKINLVPPMLVVISAPLVLFSIFQCHWAWHNLSRPAVVFAYYFWCHVMVSFMRASTSDAGSVPRNLHLTHDYLIPPSECYNVYNIPHVNGGVVELKYCLTCRIWRPPRSFHCNTCGTCIADHDHHCMWLNNCVGGRNYRYFFMFLVSVVVECALLIGICGYKMHKSKHVKAADVIVLLYCALAILYPLLLLICHLFFTQTEQRTREFLRRVHSGENYCRGNTFSVGSARNMLNVVLKPRGRSLLSAQNDHRVGDWRFRRLSTTMDPHASQVSHS